MRTLLAILMSLVLLSSVGCVPLANDNGWSLFGYTKTTDTTTIQVGGISTTLLMNNAERTGPDKMMIEEDLKESGFIIGIVIRRRF